MHGSSRKQNEAYKKKKTTSKVRKEGVLGLLPKRNGDPSILLCLFCKQTQPSLFARQLYQPKRKRRPKASSLFFFVYPRCAKTNAKTLSFAKQRNPPKELTFFPLVAHKMPTFFLFFSRFSLFFRPSSHQPFFTLDQMPFIG